MAAAPRGRHGADELIGGWRFAFWTLDSTIEAFTDAIVDDVDDD